MSVQPRRWPSRAVGLVLLAAIGATLPAWAPGAVVDVLTLALLYGFLASSWNIVGGFAGQISVGHAAFFGLGAYGVGIFYLQLGLSPYLGILAGVAAASLSALLLGIVSFRLPFAGYSFLLLTLCFSELMRAIFRTVSVLGGADGMIFPFHPGIASLQFRGSAPYYFIIFGLTVCVLALTWRIRNSSFGLRLESIRDDEGAALASGIAVGTQKIKALVISAALTSLGGAFYAVLFSFITPDQVFSIDFSVAMITGALIGGRGTVWGPILGGALLWTLTEILVRLPLGSGVGAKLSIVLYGLALILIVQRLPRGIVPSLTGEIVRGRLEGATLLRWMAARFGSANRETDTKADQAGDAAAPSAGSPSKPDHSAVFGQQLRINSDS
jgi:branched-chain amino acid transport system permease protein